MLTLSILNSIFVTVIAVIVAVISISAMIAGRFQNKQDKKYDNVMKMIKDKGNVPINTAGELNIEQINSLDKEVDLDMLLKTLYGTFLELQNKIKNSDSNFEGILDDSIKSYYIKKINSFKLMNRVHVTEGIELIDYSIIEFDKNCLKFRVNINCLHYTKSNGNIISGSNLKKVEQIFNITYRKNNDNWLIANVEKAYESSFVE